MPPTPRSIDGAVPVPTTPAEAVRIWRQFAATTSVEWGGQQRSWAEHIAHGGFVDEERLVQPVIFPRFASELLGFAIGVTSRLNESIQKASPTSHQRTRLRTHLSSR